jgi:chromosome segregation ATPase
MREVKQPLTSLEQGQAAILREIGRLAETDAHLSARLDRLSGRVERIVRRLDIVS